MNVLVLNEQENIVSTLNIEIIKTMRGKYKAEDVVTAFSNFFFARMILDVTSLEDSDKILTYQKLSIGLPIDKIILLIPTTHPAANRAFISKLISMGYYNFTNSSEGIMYLLVNPNTYKDVASLHQVEEQSAPVQQEIIVTDKKGTEISKTTLSYIKTLGIKNVTMSAGASSLCYMIKKQLEEQYNKSVLAIEVNKRDFSFFKDENMISVDSDRLATEMLKHKDYGLVIVDLNDYDEEVCDETLYLVEPSIIKLNKLMLRDKAIFQKLKGKKVIINKSVLSVPDVKEFCSEAGISAFYALPPLNDRELSESVSELLKKLGIVA